VTTLVGRTVGWIALYLAVAVAPLALALSGQPPPGRDAVTEISVGLGFVGLALMGLQFALVARFESVAAPFGEDAVVQYHRQMGYLAFAMILAHPTLLFFTDTDMWRLLNPVTAPWRARFAVTAVVCLVALVVTSARRRQLRIRYEVWQVAHGVLSVAVIGFALAHVLLVGHYVNTAWKQVVWVLMSAAFVGLLGWVRLVRPVLRLRRPWVVEEVRPERGDAWTVRLAPVGHEGIAFHPGQFGWVIIGHGPFAVTQHPFSFSSSGERGDGSVEMTIKAAGDFSSSVGDVAPGTRAWVDGPHGVFTPDRNEGPGFVLIGGGVGITPLMSILRTLADRGDRRPCLLFFGIPRLEDATFLEELEALEDRLDLRVVHVLSRPHDGWTGATGYVDVDLLRQHLPPRYRFHQYFACGPPPMLDAVESILVEELRVPPERVHTERFQFV
jgi:predicted ferric reductase